MTINVLPVIFKDKEKSRCYEFITNILMMISDVEVFSSQSPSQD